MSRIAKFETSKTGNTMSDSLSQSPTRDDISSGHFVDVAPL